VAEQFAKTNGVMIIFKSKKGVYLNGLSVSPEESEVLFDRYTAVNVRAIYENKRYMIIEVVD
jgi:hypothetical protein